MTKSPALILGMLLLLSSCAIDNVQSPTETVQNNIFTPNEEKVVATFDGFLSRLNDDPKTRSSIMEDAKVTSIRKTSTSTYGGSTNTRSEDWGLPIYELTLTNPDNTTGFAVIADPEVIDEVIAYAPVGSIADTVFNKSMAIYFRDLATLSAMVAEQQTATRADIWQSGWEELFYIHIIGKEFWRWFTPEEEIELNPGVWSLHFADPVDYMGINSAYLSTKWGQKNPYNNRVPVKVAARPYENVQVGCYAVAVGQVMAFHRYPSRYNWNLLTATQTIAPTPTNSTGSIDLNRETAAQKEVSRLLIDIASAVGTEHDPITNGGYMGLEMVTVGLNRMGYSATATHMDRVTNGSAPMIKNEIVSYNRPVLYAAQGDGLAGHIWVIDAILTQERWEYTTFYVIDGSYDGNPKHGFNRYRTQGHLMHCVWGWDGNGDGWYYNFSPVSSSGAEKYYYYGKYLYTGIKPL